MKPFIVKKWIVSLQNLKGILGIQNHQKFIFLP